MSKATEYPVADACPRRHFRLLSAVLAGGCCAIGHAAAAQAPPPIQMISWMNDYTYLSDPANRSGQPWEKLSYIPLGDNPQNFLTVGGELREYYNYWQHVTLGVRDNDLDETLVQRVRLYGDLHLGRNLRLFTELGDNREFGAEFVTRPNRDKLDISQAFVDLGLDLANGAHLTVRPGRFNMPLGSGILVGTRDGANVRYAYDGLSVMLKTPKGNRINAFTTHPTTYDPDRFDDKGDDTRDFSGIYFSHPTSKASGWDLYAYSVGHDKVPYPGLTGKQRRYTYGARIFARTGPWDYDVEGVLQNGHYADESIRAWAFIGNGGYTFKGATFSPRLGLRVNAFSGDDDPGHGDLGTFEPPFPRGALYSDAGLFTMMNLINAAPTVTWTFTPRISLMLGLDAMWRASTRDAIYYGANQRPIAMPASRDRHVATAGNVQADWQVNRNLNFHVYLSHIRAGSALKSAGGDTTNYVSGWMQFRF
jgi:hypothetical protein